MISIYAETIEIEEGRADRADNPLKHERDMEHVNVRSRYDFGTMVLNLKQNGTRGHRRIPRANSQNGGFRSAYDVVRS